MIAGFINPTEGEIILDGHLISSSSGRSVPPERRNIGMVFQSYAVWPHMTVRQNVELPLRLRRVSKAERVKRVDEALELCQLSMLADRIPHELSGGQLQRVALARAFVYHPAVILLDEPLSNLDVALREELRRQLHELHRESKATFILVTHDQVEAMSLSDRVVVMRDGAIKQIGKPADIYRSPASEFVAQFVGAANILRGTVTQAHQSGTRVKCGALEVWTTNTTCPACEEVTLAIHPEAITLHPDTGTEEVPATAPEMNRCRGKVRAAYFLGRTQEVIVEVQGETLKLMHTRDVPVQEGQSVEVRVRSASVLVLPPDDKGSPRLEAPSVEKSAGPEVWTAATPL